MKKILFFFLLVVAATAFGQSEAPRRARVFGAFIGVESHQLNARYGQYDRANRPYLTFQQETAGLTIGGFGRWPLLEGLALQPEIVFSYARHRATLWADGQPTGQLSYTFADLELPLHLVLTNPVGQLPLRGSILFGGRLGLNAGGIAGPNEGVALLRERLAVDLGLGVEFGWKGWRIQPEVLYSHGLNNLHNDAGSVYDNSVDRIFRDKITLRVGVWRGK